MSTETCAYCHSENYACGTTEEKMSKGDIRTPRLYQSDLCRERVARQKAEKYLCEATTRGLNLLAENKELQAEVERLKGLLRESVPMIGGCYDLQKAIKKALK